MQNSDVLYILVDIPIFWTVVVVFHLHVITLLIFILAYVFIHKLFVIC